MTFPNIRFVDNALAHRELHEYDLIEAPGTILSSGRRGCRQGTWPCGIAFLGGFDGPFVALLPGPVHPPRDDDVHDRERRQLHLWRRHRRTGRGALPDRRCRAPDLAQPRTRRWAKSTWTALSSSSMARSRTRWRFCWTSPKYCRAGPSCNGGCATWSGMPSNSIRAAVRGTMSRVITISTDGSIPSFSTPTNSTVAPISNRRRRPLTMPSSPRSAISPRSC